LIGGPLHRTLRRAGWWVSRSWIDRDEMMLVDELLAVVGC
jgi:hypothetical protein